MIRITAKTHLLLHPLCRIIILINSIIISISGVVEAERAIHFRIALCRGFWQYHVSVSGVVQEDLGRKRAMRKWI